MGAFDGLNFYQSTYNYRPKEEPVTRNSPVTYYVSWDGVNGGATGKHYRTKKKAIAAYGRKFRKGLHPAYWFPM